jgi:hypothetical protein
LDGRVHPLTSLTCFSIDPGASVSRASIVTCRTYTPNAANDMLNQIFVTLAAIQMNRLDMEAPFESRLLGHVAPA